MKNILSLFFLVLTFNGCSQNKINTVKPTKDFYVRTGDSLPYLNYGLGEDRLGGAKITFLDSNIILKVVDSAASLYKVQLSAAHAAYIEKKNVKKATFDNKQKRLTGSWQVKGDSLYDYVTITMDEKYPYKSEMQINPSRIVVDIYGVTSNTNWINHLSTAKEIKNVWFQQVEDDVMRVYIELQHEYHWGHQIRYSDNNILTIRVKRQPPVLRLDKLTIAVDAGHGGTQVGTLGSSKAVQEKDYTLLIAKELSAQLMEKNAKVVMTRVNDTTVSMYDRLMFLEQQNPDMLISVHLNSSSKDSINGVSTYYRYIGFRPLSQYILKSMLRTGLNEFGNIGSFNFALSGPTEYINCLVEVAFLTNKADEAKVLDPHFRKQTATEIIRGIEDFLQSVKDK